MSQFQRKGPIKIIYLLGPGAHARSQRPMPIFLFCLFFYFYLFLLLLMMMCTYFNLSQHSGYDPLKRYKIYATLKITRRVKNSVCVCFFSRSLSLVFERVYVICTRSDDACNINVLFKSQFDVR